MPNFYQAYSLPWPWVAEDDFEKSFDWYKIYSAAAHRSTNLPGLRVYEEKMHILRQLLARKVGERGGGNAPETHFQHIEQADIVVHASIFKWLCYDLTAKHGHRRPFAGVTFRSFLRRILSRGDEQAALVEFGPKGEIIFRVGRSYKGGAIPLLHLCFPMPVQEEGEPAEKRVIFCGCKKQNCSKQTCKCVKNGLLCAPACHGSGGNSNCINCAHEASPDTPPLPPGLLPLCECGDILHPPRDLAAFCAARSTVFPFLTNTRPNLIQCFADCLFVWRRRRGRFSCRYLIKTACALSRAHTMSKSYLSKRFARAVQNVKHYTAQYLLTKAVVDGRKLLFYRKWALRCGVELHLCRQFTPDRMVLRYHLALLRPTK